MTVSHCETIGKETCKYVSTFYKRQRGFYMISVVGYIAYIQYLFVWTFPACRTI